jgi:hypothetical protein
MAGEWINLTREHLSSECANKLDMVLESMAEFEQSLLQDAIANGKAKTGDRLNVTYKGAKRGEIAFTVARAQGKGWDAPSRRTAETQRLEDYLAERRSGGRRF